MEWQCFHQNVQYIKVKKIKIDQITWSGMVVNLFISGKYEKLDFWD